MNAEYKLFHFNHIYFTIFQTLYCIHNSWQLNTRTMSWWLYNPLTATETRAQSHTCPQWQALGITSNCAAIRSRRSCEAHVFKSDWTCCVPRNTTMDVHSSLLLPSISAISSSTFDWWYFNPKLLCYIWLRVGYCTKWQQNAYKYSDSPLTEFDHLMHITVKCIYSALYLQVLCRVGPFRLSRIQIGFTSSYCSGFC